ncbi:SDR family NAD(P)-dependent oxidoreductase [Streptomyces sp. SID10853]|uniref:SDR family oxidoreductase n=1 Tax=Streptomyces sp. SID10853 TaxID=2706028 RepID=UPI0013C058A1|nr:SDR family NAD(P)-dependent oxidoreductase [Streptomyces sp. SID10853]NDZ78056.1 SDR family NAD(P)-dependent oxidoreductase [Streptomyces sp. SID10853]
MKLTGNTVFIAGATSGIGLGLALSLHAAGNRVIVSGRREERLAQIVAENPGIESVLLDTTDPVAVRDVTAQLVRRFPDLDVLVAMAGIMLPEDLHSGDFLSTAEATVTTNLLGPIRLVAALTEHLATRPQATIMTVSSGLAFVPLPMTPTYCATKAAVHSFTQSLRVQLADTSIEVLELAPPAVRTTLMGQEEAENAMPLDAYLDEVLDIIGSDEQPAEILVKAVEPLRYAEARGQHADVLRMLSSH